MAKAPKLTRQQIKDGLNTLPMDGLLLGSAAKHIGAGLTPKQREFARLVALGESKAGAYRQAYNSKGKPTTQRTKGYELSRRADIADTMEAFAEAQRFAESHTPAQLRAFVIQQLTKHATTAERDGDRLRALQLLGTVAEVGAFVDRKEIVTIKQSGDIRERIAEKLKLIGASTTIEAEQDAEQDAESLMAELSGQDETHTIDARAINSDGLIPEYRPETGFSHDNDILEGGGIESVEDVPTPPVAPLNRGVDVVKGVHSIPHNQSEEFPITHNQSAKFPDPHNQSPDVSHAQALSFPADVSSGVSSLPTASELDELKKELAGGEVIHNLTCTLTGDISKS